MRKGRKIEMGGPAIYMFYVWDREVYFISHTWTPDGTLPFQLSKLRFGKTDSRGNI